MAPPNHLSPPNQAINLLVKVESKLTKPTKTSFPSFQSSTWCHHKSVMSRSSPLVCMHHPLVPLTICQFLSIQSIQSSPLVCTPLVPLTTRQFLSIQSIQSSPLVCARPPLVPLTTRQFLSIHHVVVLSKSRSPSFNPHRSLFQTIRSLLSLIPVSDASKRVMS